MKLHVTTQKVKALQWRNVCVSPIRVEERYKMKIIIMGYSGSGKSTLAKKLAEAYDIPLLHLDNTKFFGDWQEYNAAEQEQKVTEFICGSESWIIDGNYLSVALERFAMSDISIFLDFNRVFCYFSALSRYLKNRGKSRESCPCIEKFDLEFQKWLLFEGRTKKRRKKMFKLFHQAQGQKLIFKNRKQVERYLKTIQKNNL